MGYQTEEESKGLLGELSYCKCVLLDNLGLEVSEPGPSKPKARSDCRLTQSPTQGESVTHTSRGQERAWSPWSVSLAS